MSLDDIEASEEDGQPLELVEIVYGLVNHRFTTSDRDIVYAGDVYTATPGLRGGIGVRPIDNNDEDLELTIPVNHAFVRRYMRNFVPPQKITCTIRRLFQPSDDTEIIFVGEITSMSIDDGNTEATFRVPVRPNEAATRQIPVLSIGRVCPYVLYGYGCNVDRDGSGPGSLAFKVSSTVISVNGRDVRVDLGDVDRNGQWARAGELVVTSGEANTERMTIRDQTDLSPGFSSVADLSMQLPIPGLKIGDSVDIFAGCDWTIDGTNGCGPKFDNKDNFGGYPQLPNENPFWWNR